MNKKAFIQAYQKGLATFSGPGRISALREIEKIYIKASGKFQEGQTVFLNDNENTNVPVRVGHPIAYSDGRIVYPINCLGTDDPFMISMNRFNEQYLDEPDPGFDTLKKRAVKQGLSAKYIHYFKAFRISGDYLSAQPSDKYLFVIPMEDPIYDINITISQKLGLDKLNDEKGVEQIRITKENIDHLFSDQFKTFYFELRNHFLQGHSLSENWTPEKWNTLKKAELEILAKTLNIPHTGTKDQAITRTTIRLRVMAALKNYSHDQINEFGDCDMCRYDKGVERMAAEKRAGELDFLCQTAGLMTNTTSYCKALFLLKLKDQIKQNFEKAHIEYLRQIPKTIRNIIEGRIDNLQKTIIEKHPDLELFQDAIKIQASYKKSFPEKKGNSLASTQIKTAMPIFDSKTGNYMKSLGKRDIKIICSLSGGKDSIASYLLAKAKGIPIHSVVFADTEWEFPEVYQMLRQIEEQDDIKIIRLLPQKPFDELLIKYSWPHMRGRWCTERKTANIVKYLNQIKERESVMVECIGFAADEVNRALKMQNSEKKEWPAFPLIDENMKEKDALAYAYGGGFYWGDSVKDGLYASFDRVSCFCCPLKNKKELEVLRTQFPAYWQRMLDMEKTIIGRPDQIIGFQGKKKLEQIDKDMAIAAGEIEDPDEDHGLFSKRM